MTRASRRWAASFGALHERNFRLLFIGRVVSTTGDKIAPVALAFAVLELTGSPADLGFILAARVVAMISLLLAGGVWSDRLSRRSVLIGTDLLRLGSQGATALLLLGGSATVWQLALLQACAGAGQAFFRPASTGLVPETVSPERLQNANSLLGLSEQSTTILGPLIAGALVAGFGPAWAIGLDACTYGVSALFLSRLDLEKPLHPRPAGSFWRDLSAGFAEFWSRHWLVALVGAFALYHLAFFAPFYVLGPTVAQRDLGGASAWATILAVYGAGAVAGAATALRVTPARPLLVVALLFALDAPVLVALAVSSSVPVIAASAALSGLASGYGLPLWETTLQQRVPRESLSRVSSYDWLGSMSALPLGYAIVGPLASFAGVSAVLIGAALVMLAAVPLLLCVRSVRVG